MSTFASTMSTDRPWRMELRAMLALALPMVLTNLAQNAMQTTDVLMMGWLGPRDLAAGTLGFNIYFSPMMFGMGLLLSVSPMIAFEIGRKAHSVRDVRRTVRQGLWIGIMVAVPIMLLLYNGEHILVAMGQDPELAAAAASYLRAMMWAVIPFYGYMVLRSFVAALERPAWALGTMLVAVVFNAFANWVLMFGNLGFPRLGIMGAGIATALSSTLMFATLALVVMVHRRFRRYRLFGRFWRADWPRFREMIRLGLPIAGIIVFETSLFGAAGLLMGLIDANSLAAHAVALQIASLAFMVPMGIGQAATVRVGRADGAGNRDGVTRAGWTAWLLGVSFMSLTALLMILVPELLVSAFIDISDPANQAVVQLAVGFLALAALFQIVDGAQAVSAGMLRGLRDTTTPMVYAALGYWGVGMPVAIGLAFGLGMDGRGIWLGLVAGLAVVAVLLLVRWTRRSRLSVR
jgi:multidrug resistance protein, MATE family